MKYIASLILIALLGWTWCLANNDRLLTLEQHKRVEAGVEQDIRGLIQRRYPNLTDLYCPQLYTEMVSIGSELIAHFRCKVTTDGGNASEAAEQVFEGELRLKSNDGFNTWWEVGGEVRGKEIRFLEGTKVTPSDNDESDAPTTQPPADHH